MVFLAVHVLEQPALTDGLASEPGAARQRCLVLLKSGKVHALYAGGYAAKSQVHYLTGQAHRLEQLGAAIRADRRYAHFGHDFQQALVDPLAVVLVAGTGLAQHLTVAYQLLQHAVSQVGIDRRGAKTQQAGNLVGVARTGGFNHDIGIHPQAAANQVMVHGARRQQAVDGQAVARNGAIGQHEYGKPVADRLLRRSHQVLDCLAQAFFRGVIGALELLHHEPWPVELHQGGIFAVGQYRRGQHDPIGVVGAFLEHVLLAAQVRHQRHDDGLAQGIYGRIGNLGKLLAEVVVQRALQPRQHRHGRVIAHGADSLVAGFRQRPQHLVSLLEAHLEHFHVGVELRGIDTGGQFTPESTLDALGFFLQPALVWLAGLEAIIDLIVLQQFPGLGIDHEYLARPDPALGHHVLALVAVGPHLGGEGDKAVAGLHPASGTQAVAIQQANRVATIG